MQIEQKDLHVTMRLSAKSDEKILAKFFYDSLKTHPSSPFNEPAKPLKIIEKLCDFDFSRKKILHFLSEKHLENWDELLFWLILNESIPIGFTMVMRADGKERNTRRAGIYDIYLLSEFRKKKIERQIVTKIYDFCDENDLKLGFSANPEWELFEEENK